MYIYGKDIGTGANNTPTLTYTVNGGSDITSADITTNSCVLRATINGLSAGDNIVISTLESYALSGANGATVCPAAVGAGGVYSFTMSAGANNKSITVNRDAVV